MDHFKPHPWSSFEGYYSKFRLPSGAHLALIICTVKNAQRRPHMVSVTYVAADSKSHWQREYWPEHIAFVDTGLTSFEMRIEGIGVVECSSTTGERYTIETEDFMLHGQTRSETREPWIQGDASSTPAGLLVHAPLPIQWHVHTLCSEADFELNFTNSTTTTTAKDHELSLHERDRRGRCTIHHEKNWAQSFPDKYIWIQAWDPDRRTGICVAGGEALPGVEAYLLTYTARPLSPSAQRFENGTADQEDDEEYSMVFTPPWTFGILNFSPFCHTRHSYSDRTSTLDVCSLRRRVVIRCRAPSDTFFPLSAPLPEGHRSNFACESFAATIEVTIYRRSWPWAAWQVEREDNFKRGSLEFGGGYYDNAGGKED